MSVAALLAHQRQRWVDQAVRPAPSRRLAGTNPLVREGDFEPISAGCGNGVELPSTRPLGT